MKSQENINSSLRSQEVQKKTIFKPLLTNPYTRKNLWPKIDSNLQNDLLQALETNLLDPIKQWNSLDEKEKKNALNSNNDHLNILYGFNSIMGALESQVQLVLKNENIQNPITILFVCKNDISSKLLYNHLPTLCALSNVKLISLPKGSAKRLSIALGLKKDIQFLAIKKELSDKDNFILSTINSTIEDIKVGFLENLQNQNLNMNVKFVKTEMPILKKQSTKKK
jgi:ribonuclease P/MRP protein subunit POP3